MRGLDGIPRESNRRLGLSERICRHDHADIQGALKGTKPCADLCRFSPFPSTIGDRGDREIVYVPNVDVPFPAPIFLENQAFGKCRCRKPQIFEKKKRNPQKAADWRLSPWVSS